MSVYDGSPGIPTILSNLPEESFLGGYGLHFFICFFCGLTGIKSNT